MASFNRVMFSGSTDTISVPFGYLDKSHVVVSLGGVVLSSGAYSWPSAGQVKITAGNPATGVVGEVRRVTPTTPIVDFEPGNLDTDDLDTASIQAIYLAEEAKDNTSDIIDRAWYTAGFQNGGLITKGAADVVPKFDASGNMVPGPSVANIDAAQGYALLALGYRNQAADFATLAATFDPANFYTKLQADARYYTRTDLDTKFDTKGNLSGGNTWAGSQVWSGAITSTIGGQAITLRSAATGVGPVFIRFQDLAGTSIGYVGLGSALDRLELVRNTVGEIRINPVAGGTISLLAGAGGTVSVTCATFSYNGSPIDLAALSGPPGLTLSSPTRSLGTTYQNTGSTIRLVTLTVSSNSIIVDMGPTTAVALRTSSNTGDFATQFLVPPGWYYKVTGTGLTAWQEGQIA